jgi:AraC-like DNA-binding protein
MAVSDPFAPADPLAEALHYLRMNGAFYCRSELSAPWGMTLMPMPGCMWFHVVCAGRAWVESGAAAPLLLAPGELALVPHGEGHRLRSEPGAPAPEIMALEREVVSDRYEVIRHGGGGTPTALICGAVRFEHAAARSVVDLLPDVIHVVAADAPRTDRLFGTLALLAAEAIELEPGGEAVITRLADIVVIQALRWWIETDPAARTGWLGALRDPQMGRAVALIQREPARPWTLAALAGEVAMSRSAFAARFTQLVGEPPMEYVTRWRMHVALTALMHDGATASELAHRLGYRSEAAFARAFKRVVGVPPGAVKRAPAVGLVAAG